MHHCLALDLPEVEISVVLCDDAFIETLNATWRDEHKPTDVLSFPALAPFSPIAAHEHLGDVIINLNYAERLIAKKTHRARVAGELGVEVDTLKWTLHEEVEFLFIHGLLHLIGHDHAEPEEERAMMKEEKRLWLSAKTTRATS